jgi:hypothetical protein
MAYRESYFHKQLSFAYHAGNLYLSKFLVSIIIFVQFLKFHPFNVKNNKPYIIMP